MKPNARRPGLPLLCTFAALALTAGLAADDPPRWKQHDMRRPHPPVIEPAPAGSPGRAPAGAVVLFDGSNLDAWRSTNGGGPAAWKVVDGCMQTVPGAGAIETKKAFGDVQLHIEWSAPSPPVGTGQDRGNSGVFLMGKFEVQVLDSFKADTYADGQAGAIYGQYPPLFNAARPPGEWQTYDIAFRHPRFDAQGKLAEPARLTVFFNGVLVQNNEQAIGPTSWLKWLKYAGIGERGPISLQDHDHPVRYRNIWLVELPERAAPTPQQTALPRPVALPVAKLDRFAGRYRLNDKPDAPVAVFTREGSTLSLALPFRPEALVAVPVAENVFDLPYTDGRFTFQADASGKVTGVRVRVGDAEREWVRVGE